MENKVIAKYYPSFTPPGVVLSYENYSQLYPLDDIKVDEFLRTVGIVK